MILEDKTPDKATGHWKTKELEALKNGMETLGPDWHKIADMIPTRSWSQIVRKGKHMIDKREVVLNSAHLAAVRNMTLPSDDELSNDCDDASKSLKVQSEAGLAGADAQSDANGGEDSATSKSDQEKDGKGGQPPASPDKQVGHPNISLSGSEIPGAAQHAQNSITNDQSKGII